MSKGIGQSILSDEEKYFIKLSCDDCENLSCSLCPIGTYIPQDSQQGCTKEVCENDYIQYENFLHERIPFMRTLSEQESRTLYNDYIDFLNKIYQSPTKNRLGKSGKVLKNIQ